MVKPVFVKVVLVIPVAMGVALSPPVVVPRYTS